MARFTKGKGWRVIAFLRVPVAMDVAMDILPLEKNFGGVSKCPRKLCTCVLKHHPGAASALHIIDLYYSFVRTGPHAILCAEKSALKNNCDSML